MQKFKFITRAGLGAAVLASCCLPNLAVGQDQASVGSNAALTKLTTEPVFRTPRLARANPAAFAAPVHKRPKANPAIIVPSPSFIPPDRDSVASVGGDSKSARSSKLAVPANSVVAPHPLDRALAFAEGSLATMRSDVYDYTARMAKRERINGTLSKTSFMDIKIRCPRVTPQGQQTPFSIYMKFLKPRAESGREVLWIDGRYNGNLLAHQPGGLIGMKTFEFPPTGMMAMRGQRYPIYEAGLENLVVKLIEKATRDRAAGMCEVTYRDGLAMNGRPCSLIEVVHQVERAPYEFHKAQILIDDELNMPVRYTSYDWPKSPGAKPEIVEQYTYMNIKVNVGLTDKDFDPSNPAYDFPGR